MNSQLDSLTPEELEQYCFERIVSNLVRKTTGCIGCDEQQKIHNNRTSMCKNCEQQMKAFEEGR
jgi:hypothetical protein